MKLELYYSETSPFARKVRATLLEKGAPFAGIDVRRDERKAKDKNPLGKVPTLLVDGVALFDSVVLTEYLDNVFPEPPLIPKGYHERAEVRRFEALADGICDVLIPVVTERRRPEAVQNVALIEALVEKIKASLALLSQAARGRVYLHGDGFSLADIAVVSALGYVNLRAPELLDDLAEVRRYHERQLERPSLQETIPPNLPPL